MSGSKRASIHLKMARYGTTPFRLLLPLPAAFRGAASGRWRSDLMKQRCTVPTNVLYSVSSKVSTVLIDPAGVIAYMWPKVRLKGHVEAVARKLEELQT